MFTDHCVVQYIDEVEDTLSLFFILQELLFKCGVIGRCFK